MKTKDSFKEFIEITAFLNFTTRYMEVQGILQNRSKWVLHTFNETGTVSRQSIESVSLKQAKGKTI